MNEVHEFLSQQHTSLL